jgi:hypothetical protein
MSISRHTVLAAGIAAGALTAVALAVANFVSAGDGGTVPYAVTLVASLAIATAVFGWAIPRTERPARAGVITGLLGVLSVAVFWTGLPTVLGPAAIVYGLLGRARNEATGAATIAVALGALATLGGIAAIVLDWTT